MFYCVSWPKGITYRAREEQHFGSYKHTLITAEQWQMQVKNVSKKWQHSGLNEQEHLPLRKGPGWFQLCHLAGQPIKAIGKARYHLLLVVSGGFKKSTFWEKTSICAWRSWHSYVIDLGCCAAYEIRSCSVRVVPLQFRMPFRKLDDDICRNRSWSKPESSPSPALGKRDYNTHSYIYIMSYNHNPSN